MVASAQRRASEAYRKRLAAAGLKRFEVRAPVQDQALIKQLASKLARADEESRKLRADLKRRVTLAEDAQPRGGVWAALRASPLVGADLDVSGDAWVERDVEL